MTARIVIPMRPPEEGKARLAAHLPAADRIALILHMFDHVLDVARACVPAGHCTVVSRSEALLARAQARGAQPLPEAGHGLNAALEQASAHLAAQCDAPVLALNGDLPLLTPADVQLMLGLQSDVVCAPDRSGTGSNALAMKHPGLLRYAFGPGSLAAHRKAAAAAGLCFATVDRIGLALDIDTPHDLDRQLALGGPQAQASGIPA